MGVHRPSNVNKVSLGLNLICPISALPTPNRPDSWSGVGHPQGEFNLLVIRILNLSGLSEVSHPQSIESGSKQGLERFYIGDPFPPASLPLRFIASVW
jgi:hypothetical protein